ncbi:mitochondrial dynamin GTPase Msp1 [Umbelopsis sp. WA50703]
MMVLQTRQFSIGRLFVTATRVPVILVGAAAGGVAYVNHKIEEYKEKGQDLMSTVADELESLVNRAQSLGNNIHLPSFLTGLFDRTPKDSDPLAHDVQEALTSEEKAAKKIILRMHQDELSDLAQKLDDAKALLRKLDDLGDKQDHKPLDLPPIAVIGPQAYQLIHQLIGLEITTDTSSTGTIHLLIEYDPQCKDHVLKLGPDERAPLSEATNLIASHTSSDPLHITVISPKYPDIHMMLLSDESNVATTVDPDALVVATDLASQQTIDPLGRRSIVVDANDKYTPRRLIAYRLEQYITPILFDISRDANRRLEEAQYSFKVDYDGRSASAESYLAGRMEELKQGITQLETDFNRQRVRDVIRELIEREMIAVCERTCWTSQDADPEVAGGLITRSGIGRSTTQLMASNVMQAVQELTAQVFGAQRHEDARDRVLTFAQQILRTHEPTACDQVENTIKPFKYEVEVSDREWATALKRAIEVVEQEKKRCDDEYRSIQQNVDRSQFNAAMKQLAKTNAQDVGELPFDDRIVANAVRAIALRDKSALLKMRLAVLKSRRCRSLENKSQCQEAFLCAVTEKVTYTASMFLQVELLNEFFFEFSREIDDQLVYGMTQKQIAQFARENPHIMAQLDAQDRRRQLEDVVSGLNDLARHRVADPM